MPGVRIQPRKPDAAGKKWAGPQAMAGMMWAQGCLMEEGKAGWAPQGHLSQAWAPAEGQREQAGRRPHAQGGPSACPDARGAQRRSQTETRSPGRGTVKGGLLPAQGCAAERSRGRTRGKNEGQRPVLISGDKPNRGQRGRGC